MAGRQRILIVDDGEDIAELISLYLEKECFETHIAPDGAMALSLFHLLSPDLVFLDLIPLHVDGCQVCREIRKSTQTPVIMLSAKREIFGRVLELELGTDNCIIKPLEPRKLVAHIRAVLYHYRPQEAVPPARTDTDVAHYEDLGINLTNYAIRYEGRPVRMPSKELELLYFIASHSNQVFTRGQLLDHIQGYEYADDTRTIDVHVKRLRGKLEDKPS